MVDESDPGVPNPDRRLQGLRRWEQWLTGRLSPNAVVREEAAAPGRKEAVWRIGFREGGWSRVRIADHAVHLTEAEFEVLTDRLERVDWIGRLREAGPRGIRIRRDGQLEEGDPEAGAGENGA